MIEIQGYCPESLTAITYDLSNAAGVVTGQQVLILDQNYDTNTFEYTTNAFQAFDVPLTNGDNNITPHATDMAGNVTTTNFSYTLDYSTKTNPPVVKLFWPQDQTVICVSNYTWHGWVDDFTATVVAQMVDTNGNTNLFNAAVERDGNFWVENMPLSSGTNYLTLTATDAVGNVTTTNITVFSGAVTLTINPPTSDQLWSNAIVVTGTISDSTDYTVWVNGAKATLNGDGTWTATNVYLPMGGTAVLQARAIPNTNNGGSGTGGSGGGPVTYDNLGNPDPAPDVDAEIQVDKPTRLYVSSYTETENGFQDLSDYYMDGAGNPVTPEGLYSTWYREIRTGNIAGSWQDGVGGSSSWTQQEIDTSSVGTLTDNSWVNLTYKPTLYPDMEVATSDVSDDDLSSPFIISWEHCDVAKPLIDLTGSCLIPPEYTYDYYFDLQTVKEPETRNAQATIKLFTGGKGVPGQESIFIFTATAASAIFAKDPPPTQINLSYEPTQPILPTSIAVGELGNLDSDAMLTVDLPDNVTKTTTPTVQGNQDYVFAEPLPSRYTPVITANGVTLDPNQVVTGADFCVGQQITFDIGGLPPHNNNDDVATWTLPGTFVNEQTNPVCDLFYDENTALLRRHYSTDKIISTSCWYVLDGQQIGPLRVGWYRLVPPGTG